ECNVLLDSVKKEEKDIEVEFPIGIINTIDRVSIFSDLVDKSPYIIINIKKDCIEFSSKKNSGEIKEKIPLKESFDENFSEKKVYINPLFLNEISKKTFHFYLKQLPGKNIFVFYTNNYLQITSTYEAPKGYYQ
ncbi:hypothetical protein KY334_07330, partial [Candidatus Woesearchaeota archaeon]|nr:hypothetical protein [Candidatus Woesearchaeota archaeon]